MPFHFKIYVYLGPPVDPISHPNKEKFDQSNTMQMKRTLTGTRHLRSVHDVCLAGLYARTHNVLHANFMRVKSI
jgi:hypothetical protein